MRIRRRRTDIIAEAPDIKTWESPPIDAIREEHRAQYWRNMSAVKMWASLATESAIRKHTGLGARKARALFGLCSEPNPYTGKVIGFWGCNPALQGPRRPRARVKELDTAAGLEGRGQTGALKSLFTKFPEIKCAMEKFLEKREVAPTMCVPLLRLGMLHGYFLSLCRKYEVPKDGWPYNVKHKGYKAISRWANKMKHAHPIASADNFNGETEREIVASAFKQAAFTGLRHSRLAYERVEFDEHYMDAMFSVHFPFDANHPELVKVINVRRLWALALIETRALAVLSSTIAYGTKYNQFDVKRLIRNAILAPGKRHLTLDEDEYRYAEGASYPGEVEEFRGLTWQILACDGDKSHLSRQVAQGVEDTVGCHVVYEALGQPKARFSVENFFNNIARLCAWLPSATGNRPDSPARRAPEAEAVRHAICAHLAEELLDVMCRNYNVTPNMGCGGLSPLARLRELLQRGEIFHLPVNELTQNQLWKLLPCYRAQLNRKGSKTDVGPYYVELHGGRYISQELASADDLAVERNRECLLYVDEDARFAHMVPMAHPNRVFRLCLTGAMASVPHTLEMRRHTYAFYRKERKRFAAEAPNLMVGLLTGLANSGTQDVRAGNLLADVGAFMIKHTRGDITPVSMDAADAERFLDAAQEFNAINDDNDEQTYEQAAAVESRNEEPNAEPSRTEKPDSYDGIIF